MLSNWVTSRELCIDSKAATNYLLTIVKNLPTTVKAVFLLTTLGGYI